MQNIKDKQLINFIQKTITASDIFSSFSINTCSFMFMTAGQTGTPQRAGCELWAIKYWSDMRHTLPQPHYTNTFHLICLNPITIQVYKALSWKICIINMIRSKQSLA